MSQIWIVMANSSKKRIGILGGAFDPPTLGHALNVSVALNSGKLDEVWLVPSAKRVDKTYTASDQHRVKMLELMIANSFADEAKVKLSTIQTESANDLSTTISLWDQLYKIYPQYDFCMLIGDELIADLPSWKNVERLRKEVLFLVINRGQKKESLQQDDFKLEFLSAPKDSASSVSSTLARSLIKQGKSCAGVIPEAVLHYIRLHNLYEYPKQKIAKRILAEGNFTRLVDVDTWEFVERRRCSAVVVVVAVTNENKILLVEQYRIPLQKNAIEFPAGLAGDVIGEENESLEAAAKRELLEETGYQAQSMQLLTFGPPSSGLSTELIYIFKAQGLTKINSGGGVDDENIIVHEVKLDEIEIWLKQAEREGKLIDPKIYSGLYFLLSSQ